MLRFGGTPPRFRLIPLRACHLHQLRGRPWVALELTTRLSRIFPGRPQLLLRATRTTLLPVTIDLLLISAFLLLPLRLVDILIIAVDVNV